MNLIHLDKSFLHTILIYRKTSTRSGTVEDMMAKSIDKNRLSTLLKSRGWSQAELARKSKVNKDTISRLMVGNMKRAQQTTVERLAKAMDVETGVITGDLDMPSNEPKPAVGRPPKQLSIRVSIMHQNALWLASKYYNIPMIRIIELAPLLFVLAAEESLDRRRAKLSQLRALYEGNDAIAQKFLHLNAGFLSRKEAEKVFELEEVSISTSNIFAEDIIDSSYEKSGIDMSRANPFAEYLDEKCIGRESMANLAEFGPKRAAYFVCDDYATDLAGGNEGLASSIQFGELALADMPRNLWSPDATTDRLQRFQNEATWDSEPNADEVDGEDR